MNHRFEPQSCRLWRSLPEQRSPAVASCALNVADDTRSRPPRTAAGAADRRWRAWIVAALSSSVFGAMLAGTGCAERERTQPDEHKQILTDAAAPDGTATAPAQQRKSTERGADAALPATRPDADSASEASAQPAPAQQNVSDAAVTGDAGATPGERCQQLRAAGAAVRMLQSGGVSREYLLFVPASGTEPLSLVIDLHGLLTHAEFQRATSGYASVGDSDGFVVAYPQARDSAWNFGTDGCCGPDPKVDDHGFVRDLARALAADGCIDAQRVYAVGDDVGGGLAQELACRDSDVFAAVASRGFDLLENSAAACAPARPIAVLTVRDPKDTAVPYEGGEFRPANGLPVRIRAMGAAATFMRWAELDGCASAAAPAADGCQVRSGCAGDVELRLCEPGGAPPEKIWQFLRRFRRP
jgi:polyhydroxybutyrate depolymerase